MNWDLLGYIIGGLTVVGILFILVCLLWKPDNER